MAKQQNKGMIIGIAVAVVVVIAIIIGVVVAVTGGGNGGSDGGEPETGRTNNYETEMDFSNIDASVAFGDYDTMYTQAKAIQNGEMVDAVIKIDGIVSHPMSKYSIVEKDGNGSAIGTEFIIDGLDESSYPQDGDHIVITGRIIEKEPLYFVIQTTPQYVEMIESASEIEE